MTNPDSIAARIAAGAPAPRSPIDEGKSVRTVVRGPIPADDVVVVAEILRDESLDEDGKVEAIAKVPDISTEGAMILVRSWYDGRRDRQEWDDNALYGFIQQRLISKTQGRIAMNKTAAAILRVDAWKNGKPEISVHNQWFIVDKIGTDLGKLTRVRELNGWTVTQIVPNRYIVVTSPDGGEEHDLAVGYAEYIASVDRLASGAPTKEEVKPFMYEPTGDHFFERKSDGLYLTLYKAHDAHRSLSNALWNHFNVEPLSGMGEPTIRYRITRKASAKTADAHAIADAVATAKKSLSVLNGLRREISRIVGEVRRDQSIGDVEGSLLACLGELGRAGDALNEAIYQGNTKLSDREMGWMR